VVFFKCGVFLNNKFFTHLALMPIVVQQGEKNDNLSIINLEGVSEISAMAYDAYNRAHSFYWEDEDTEE